MITPAYRSQNRIPVLNAPEFHKQPDTQKPCPEMIISCPTDHVDLDMDTIYNYQA